MTILIDEPNLLDEIKMNCMYVRCMAITMFMDNILGTTVILAKLYTNY